MMMPSLQLGQTGVVMALLNGGHIVLAHNGMPGKTIDNWKHYLVVIDNTGIKFYVDNNEEAVYNYSSHYSKNDVLLTEWISSFNAL